ncbi:MAG: hypothetical protein MHM6MM_009559, partial [Cercozoa sp. M6MM]
MYDGADSHDARMSPLSLTVQLLFALFALPEFKLTFAKHFAAHYERPSLVPLKVDNVLANAFVISGAVKAWRTTEQLLFALFALPEFKLTFAKHFAAHYVE